MSNAAKDILIGVTSIIESKVKPGTQNPLTVFEGRDPFRMPISKYITHLLARVDSSPPILLMTLVYIE